MTGAPSGHQASQRKRREKKKTLFVQSTFAYDLIMLHGWFMAIWVFLAALYVTGSRWHTYLPNTGPEKVKTDPIQTLLWGLIQSFVLIRISLCVRALCPFDTWLCFARNLWKNEIRKCSLQAIFKNAFFLEHAFVIVDGAIIHNLNRLSSFVPLDPIENRFLESH